jgi:cyclic beta-1,2-glucan synthetase
MIPGEVLTVSALASSARRTERGRTRVYVCANVATSIALAGLVAYAMLRLGGEARAAWAAALVSIPLARGLAQQAVHTVLRAILPVPPPLSELDTEEAEAAVATTCFIYPIIVHDEHDVADLIATMRQARLDHGVGFVAHVALVDFSDGIAATDERDDGLRHHIEERLRAENAADKDASGPPMVALFRDRRWNPREGVWMGWERKRGKILEFVRLVTGTRTTTFLPADRLVVARLQAVRYVITLDVHSSLYPGCARRLVATMGHPDNRPVVDAAAGRVVSGFGFIRPFPISRKPRTLFAWTVQSKGRSGRISVLLHYFGRDRFLGQGIFDVAAFRATLDDTIPENALLSHDKLEGMHANATCQNLTLLVEDAPEDYLAARKRDHRWVRGDVQQLAWVVAGRRSGLRRLPLLDRYSMVDDVMARLSAASSVALLVVAWLSLPGARAGLFAAGVILVPLLAEHLVVRPVLAVAQACRQRCSDRPAVPIDNPFVREYYRHVTHKTLAELASLPSVLILLADRAVNAVDATVRALYRMLVSHRHLLQWTASRAQGRTLGHGLLSRYRAMSASCGLSVVVGGAVELVNPSALPWAAPLLVLWLTAPVFVHYSARPARRLPFTRAP